MGEAAILAAKWPDAEAALVKAVALDPLLGVAHYGLGQTYMAERRFREAVEAFSTSRQAFRCATPSEDDLKQRSAEILQLREAIRNADKRRLQELGVKGKEVNGDVRTAGGEMRGVQEAERRLAELETSAKRRTPHLRESRSPWVPHSSRSAQSRKPRSNSALSLPATRVRETPTTTWRSSAPLPTASMRRNGKSPRPRRPACPHIPNCCRNSSDVRP